MQSNTLSLKTFLWLIIFVISSNACQNNEAETPTKEENTPSNTTVIDSNTMTGTDNIDTLSDENLEIVDAIVEDTPTKSKKITQPNTQKSSKNEVTQTKSNTTPQSTQTSSSNTKPKPAKSETVESQPTTRKSNISLPKNTSTEKEQPKVRKPKPILSHKIWDDLLRKYVSSTGKVNYAGFKKDKAKLNQYLQLLADNPPKSGWSRNKQISYWINAYNAFTVDLIVDNYPISSILKLDDGKTWYVKRITIGEKKYSLNDIEKNILIGKFKEGRVHFAINCAAKSCPPLKNRAWSENSLNTDLDKATKAFINNTSFNQIKKKSATLSQIFNWYKADFGDVIPYLNKYSNVQLSSKTKMNFNEYDWNLNQ